MSSSASIFCNCFTRSGKREMNLSKMSRIFGLPAWVLRICVPAAAADADADLAGGGFTGADIGAAWDTGFAPARLGKCRDAASRRCPRVIGLPRKSAHPAPRHPGRSPAIPRARPPTTGPANPTPPPPPAAERPGAPQTENRASPPRLRAPQNVAAQQRRQPLADRQPQPRPAEPPRRRSIRLRERLKQPRRLLLRHPDPRVANIKMHDPALERFLTRCAHQNLPLARELHRVRH